MSLDPLLTPLGLLVLAVILVGGAIFLTPRPGPEAGVCRGTRFFLVMLRLAIGWHFLFEGVEKWTTPNWSSEAYLREASGPLAPYFREMAGDQVKDLVTVVKDEDGKAQLPPRLAAEWDADFDRFVHHYQLTEEQQKLAQTKFEQAKQRMIVWLTVARQAITVASKVPPPIDKNMTVAERVQQYEDLLAKATRIEEYDVPLYGQQAWAKVREAKTEANRLRNGLKKEVEAQTKEMMATLAQILRPAPLFDGVDGNKVVDGPLKDRMQLEWRGYLIWFEDHHQLDADQRAAARERYKTAKEEALKFIASGKRSVADVREKARAMMASLDGVLTGAQLDPPPPVPVTRPPLSSWSRLHWSDAIVTYGLLAVGILLIAGLLTRTACLAGAVFLLSFFLAMPPLPGLPESPRAEGHYLYINKNIIEMLALLSLATTRSGRWAGIDGLLHLLAPGSWRTPRPTAPLQTPAPQIVSATRTAPRGDSPAAWSSPVKPSEEISHGS
jgi:uncharacterized membrane protein YphA (DoxX/SURF4 family)